MNKPQIGTEKSAKRFDFKGCGFPIRVYPVLISVFICVFSSASFAQENWQPEFGIARADYLYSQGQFREALMELQMILTQDPRNRLAREYLNETMTRIYEKEQCTEGLRNEKMGLVCAQIARKKIEITEQERYVKYPRDEIYERFINTLSLGYHKQQAGSTSDMAFQPTGFYIEEHFRFDSWLAGYQSTLLANVRYHDDSREDGRIRRGTYSLSNDAVRFILGDTSTALSRYVLRGMYYRGANLSIDTGKNKLKLLYGAVPNYLTLEEEYIQPRRIFGIRDQLKITEEYVIGLSLMHLTDSRRVRNIDSTYNPKENWVIAIDQNYQIVPGMWNLKTESAYSRSDEDRTNEDILIKEEELADFSHYIRSEIRMPKLALINSYERLGPDFRSYADIASTTTWYADLASDREHIYNYLEYRPTEPIYLSLQFSHTRNNMDKDNDVETNRRAWYGANLTFFPEPDSHLPRFSIRGNVFDVVSSPGSQYATDESIDRDIIFELAKQLYDIDLNASYTNRKLIENIQTYGTYTDVYTIRAAKQLFERVMLSTAYSFSDSDQKIGGDLNSSANDEYLALNTSMKLWDTSNLSLGYNIERNEDLTNSTDVRTDSLFTAFTWPFTRTFPGGARLTFAPHLTYQSATRDNSSRDRSVWTSRFDGSYYPTEDQRLSVNAEYRQDQDDDNPTAWTDDYRLLFTYKALIE